MEIQKSQYFICLFKEQYSIIFSLHTLAEKIYNVLRRNYLITTTFYSKIRLSRLVREWPKWYERHAPTSPIAKFEECRERRMANTVAYNTYATISE